MKPTSYPTAHTDAILMDWRGDGWVIVLYRGVDPRTGAREEPLASPHAYRPLSMAELRQFNIAAGMAAEKGENLR